MTVDYAKDGRQFATGGKDNIVRVYDESTKKVISELKSVKWFSPGHNNRLFCVKWNLNDSNILLSGGWDQNINVWDVREGQPVSTLQGPKISGDSIDIQG